LISQEWRRRRRRRAWYIYKQTRFSWVISFFLKQSIFASLNDDL